MICDAMNSYEANNRFDVDLQQPDKQMGLVSFFHCEAEGTFDIQIPRTEDPFSLIINLGPASDCYIFNGIDDTVPMGHFNFFYVPGDSLRWRFKEGINNFIVLRIKESLMRVLCESGPFEAFVERSSPATSVCMNDKAHPVIPIMDHHLAVLLSNSLEEGMLRSVRRQTSSMSLVFDALQASQLFYDRQLTHANTNEVRRVCNYFLRNMKKVKSKEDVLALSPMNNSEFERVFDLMYHKSIPDFLLRERFEIAKALLMFSPGTIKEIAKTAGFQTPDDLIAAFEDQYSLGPEEFRALYKVDKGSESDY
jgi:AraC-like DNA-binding protein